MSENVILIKIITDSKIELYFRRYIVANTF